MSHWMIDKVLVLLREKSSRNVRMGQWSCFNVHAKMTQHGVHKSLDDSLLSGLAKKRRHTLRPPPAALRGRQRRGGERRPAQQKQELGARACEGRGFALGEKRTASDTNSILFMD